MSEGATSLYGEATQPPGEVRDEGYSEGDLKTWSDTVTRVGAGWRDTFIYFKHEASGLGPALARELQRLLTG